MKITLELCAVLPHVMAVFLGITLESVSSCFLRKKLSSNFDM